MAEAGLTVRVSGLPTGMDDDRLKDKLFIHFLRTRNGGGEVVSISPVKAAPGSALITFEESTVAQRVIQHRLHILEVDGTKYQLSVTEHHKSLEPDKVILSISATVDYSQLPIGRAAMTSLHNSHPEVQINYHATEERCTLKGGYSEVQAALTQLLGRAGDLHSAEPKDKDQPPSGAVQTDQRPRAKDSGGNRKLKDRREQRDQVLTAGPSDDRSSSPRRDETSGGHSGGDPEQTQGAAGQLPGHPAGLEEDFSLNVDADMFQYLQRHCREEYQHILCQYGVEVVDVTAEGVTTLFPQIATAVGEVGGEQERLRSASRDLQRLCQENEVKIRRAQLPKFMLAPRGELQRAIENLGVRLPKLLLSEDDQNVYIIGSSSDVSEAKNLLLLNRAELKGKAEAVASLRHSGSSSPTYEEVASLCLSPFTGSPDGGADKMLRSDEDERKADGAKKYKLAARFKDTSLAGLVRRPGDFTLAGLSSSSRRLGLGLVPGVGTLSDIAGFAGGRVPMVVPQHTGGDVLFKSGDSSLSSVQHKPSPSPDLMDTRQKIVTASLNTTQSSLPGTITISPAGSGSSLKRASSFSGMPQNKAQSTGEKSPGEAEKTAGRARGRSSSFSNRTGRDKQEVYKTEITVSKIMWHYIKEAYSTRIEDLITDVQLKECHAESSSCLSLILKGADSSKLISCHQSVQKLVAMVVADFTIQEIRLRELGVTDGSDDTLQMCCAEVRSRFSKVNIQVLKESLYILGPKKFCQQVSTSLREVFSTPAPDYDDSPGPSTSKWKPDIPFQLNEDQNVALQLSRSSQLMPERQTGEGDGTSSSQAWEVNHTDDSLETKTYMGSQLANGSVSQPPERRVPVVKEKLRSLGTLHLDGQIAEHLGSSTKGSDGGARYENSTQAAAAAAVHTDQDTSLRHRERAAHSRVTRKDGTQRGRAEIQDTRGSGAGGPEGTCACGQSGVSTTACGATACLKCLDKGHVHCRVCHKGESTQQQGIRGMMRWAKVPISLPGHGKDSVIKITYSISDGIQGAVHPSPGSPFKGGDFEAFMPDCELSRKLLPRLEKAFRMGLVFTVVAKDASARVTWDCIPHKTSINGGKSGNGYPDSTYLTRLSEVLTSFQIEETTAQE
ncbi:uncharacterized protein LOC142993431 [Genypterus blacodes]|uniref:uncharacterized protein LOC142993431 n=1 Tax=Genypterus blacodes TaxID=154954 RepID=UPI003F772E9C